MLFPKHCVLMYTKISKSGLFYYFYNLSSRKFRFFFLP